MYSRFDTSNIESVRDTIQRKLDELKSIGLNIELKNIKYDSDSIRSSIEVSLPGALDKFEKAFLSLASNHSIFLSSDLNSNKWKYKGVYYIIKGYNTRARKYPLMVEEYGTSKTFKICLTEFLQNGERV